MRWIWVVYTAYVVWDQQRLDDRNRIVDAASLCNIVCGIGRPTIGRMTMEFEYVLFGSYESVIFFVIKSVRFCYITYFTLILGPVQIISA